MNQHKEVIRRDEWRNGWRAVLGSSMGLGTGYGLYAVVASVFVKPMAAEFGWTRAELAGGHLVSGPLLDRFRPDVVAAAFLFLPGLAALMLSRVGVGLAPGPAVVIAIVLIGVAQGALVNFIGFFVARHFGVQHYAVIFEVLIAGVGLGMSTGGLTFAWSFDGHGNYRLASLCSALAFPGASLCCDRRATNPLGPQWVRTSDHSCFGSLKIRNADNQ